MSDFHHSPRETRRRLIKSAAVAPIVFTLPSGAALAAASATCDAKSLTTFVNSDPRVKAVDIASDGWVRAAFQRVDFNGKLVQTGAAQAFSGFIYEGRYYGVNELTGVATHVPHVSGQGAAVPGKSYYVLVSYTSETPIFDSATVTSISGPSPISGGSCWNSLRPNSVGLNNIIVL